MWTLIFFQPWKGTIYCKYIVQYICNIRYFILSNIFAISDTLYCPLYLQYKVSYIANILDVDFEFFSTLKRDNILQIYCSIYLQYPILYIVRYICNINYLILQIYWMRSPPSEFHTILHQILVPKRDFCGGMGTQLVEYSNLKNWPLMFFNTNRMQSRDPFFLVRHIKTRNHVSQ